MPSNADHDRRGEDCDVQVRKSGVNNVHAMLCRNEQDGQVGDLLSLIEHSLITRISQVWIHTIDDGETYVSDEIVNSKAQLFHNDIISIGGRQFAFEFGESSSLPCSH